MLTEKKFQRYLFYAILFLAAFLRLFKLGEIPLGLNQDEAYTGYEAFSLLTNGTDSWGYRFPIYFISWASGTSVLYAYLTIPFFALFGKTIWVLRLPQVLLGILSCYIFYRLLRIKYNRQIALLGFFLSAVVPWHIILSRWGLDANIAPFFLLSGLYFFARSIKKQQYLQLSALFYGLGLYTYATCWIYIVVTFALQLLYLLLYNKNKQTLFAVLIAGLIFTIFALPHFVLILINNDVISEIRTSFFSIPKLIYYRQNEIGFNDFNIKLAAIGRIFFKGEDFLITNRINPYGTLFPISLPFIFFGAYILGKEAYTDFKTRQFSLSAIILGSIIIGLIYGVTLYPCINRLNFLWFNLLILTTIGISATTKFKPLYLLILSIYMIYATCFTHTYFTKYNELAKENFTPDLKPTLAFAENYHQKTQLPITILESPSIYPKVLFYSQVPQSEYLKTVQWKYFPNAYLDATLITHFRFLSEFDYINIPTNSIYIAPVKQKYYFYQFNTTIIGNYIVATPKG